MCVSCLVSLYLGNSREVLRVTFSFRSQKAKCRLSAATSDPTIIGSQDLASATNTFDSCVLYHKKNGKNSSKVKQETWNFQQLHESKYFQCRLFTCVHLFEHFYRLEMKLNMDQGT